MNERGLFIAFHILENHRLLLRSSLLNTVYSFFRMTSQPHS